MKENMYENYSKLESRVLNSVAKTDLLKVKEVLEQIKEPTLVSGVITEVPKIGPIKVAKPQNIIATIGASDFNFLLKASGIK